jgi:hypothetical protein
MNTLRGNNYKTFSRELKRGDRGDTGVGKRGRRRKGEPGNDRKRALTLGTHRQMKVPKPAGAASAGSGIEMKTNKGQHAVVRTQNLHSWGRGNCIVKVRCCGKNLGAGVGGTSGVGGTRRCRVARGL